jgi:hypothetical protein
LGISKERRKNWETEKKAKGKKALIGSGQARFGKMGGA